MGTDIHLVIEAKRSGTWKAVAPPGWFERDEFDTKYGRWCSDRNYDAFAILADVRNGVGFTGVVTGDTFEPIVPVLRGFPEDFSLSKAVPVRVVHDLAKRQPVEGVVPHPRVVVVRAETLLKTWPAPFEAIEAGTKHHEIRKNDRLFVQGDLLQLREWDPSTEKYTGRERTVRVSYASYGGAWGLPEDICVLSIEHATPSSGKAR